MTATVPDAQRAAPTQGRRQLEVHVDERFRAWRATLEALPAFGPNGPRVVLLAGVDSAVTGAGIGLARAFAHARQRTVLLHGADAIDDMADLMNGSRQASTAIASWLSNGADTSSFPALALPLPPLMSIPLRFDVPADDPIAPAALQRLFAWACQDLDRVVMTVRPLDVSADGLLLARWADCVVIGIRPGQTSRARAMQARDDLVQAGGTVVGSISLD